MIRCLCEVCQGEVYWSSTEAYLAAHEDALDPAVVEAVEDSKGRHPSNRTPR